MDEPGRFPRSFAESCKNMNRVWLFATGMVIGLTLVLGAGWVWMNQNYQYNGVVIDPLFTARSA